MVHFRLFTLSHHKCQAEMSDGENVPSLVGTFSVISLLQAIFLSAASHPRAPNNFY